MKRRRFLLLLGEKAGMREDSNPLHLLKGGDGAISKKKG
jgi:hypothetical protein